MFTFDEAIRKNVKTEAFGMGGARRDEGGDFPSEVASLSENLSRRQFSTGVEDMSGMNQGDDLIVVCSQCRLHRWDSQIQHSG